MYVFTIWTSHSNSTQYKRARSTSVVKRITKMYYKNTYKTLSITFFPSIGYWKYIHGKLVIIFELKVDNLLKYTMKVIIFCKLTYSYMMRYFFNEICYFPRACPLFPPLKLTILGSVWRILYDM